MWAITGVNAGTLVQYLRKEGFQLVEPFPRWAECPWQSISSTRSPPARREGSSTLF